MHISSTVIFTLFTIESIYLTIAFLASSMSEMITVSLSEKGNGDDGGGGVWRDGDGGGVETDDDDGGGVETDDGDGGGVGWLSTFSDTSKEINTRSIRT